MDRNENGYPGGVVGGVTDMGGCGCNRPGNGNGNGNRPGNGNGNGNGNRPGNGNGNGNGTVGGVQTNHLCGGRGDCLDHMPLAYVYAPDQMFRLLYTANDALKHGTLFEELYKPMEVYGRE